MPEAEHGASKRMASNCWPSHQVLGCAASATTISALSPKRWRFWSIRSQRLASMSKAITWESVSNSSSKCAVLPPGAAQASRTLRLLFPSPPDELVLGESKLGVCTSSNCFESSLIASALRSPCSNKAAAHCAAGSCTDQSPSAKPGMSCTALALSNTNP